jgi:hypothetical protein
MIEIGDFMTINRFFLLIVLFVFSSILLITGNPAWCNSTTKMVKTKKTQVITLNYTSRPKNHADQMKISIKNDKITKNASKEITEITVILENLPRPLTGMDVKLDNKFLENFEITDETEIPVLLKLTKGTHELTFFPMACGVNGTKNTFIISVE